MPFPEVDNRRETDNGQVGFGDVELEIPVNLLRAGVKEAVESLEGVWGGSIHFVSSV